MIIGINGNEANVENRVGSNQYCFQLLSSLRKLSSASRQTKFRIYLKNKPVADMPKESKNWQYRVFGPGKLWTQLALPIKLSLIREKPDVFFTPGHYAPRWCPCPSVVVILDLAFLKYPESFLKKDLVQLKTWTKYSVKQASQIITISQSTKKDVIKHYGLSADKISVIYPGLISLHGQTIQFSQISKKYSIKKPYLLYVGTLQPRKNLQGLIKAFSQLKDFKGQLVIAGKKGWLYKDVFGLIEALKLTKRVIFTDYVSDSELKTLIKQAQMVINPSFYEGFGFPVLSAMSIGSLVLVSKNSSLPEIVADAGLYIDQPESVDSIKKGIIKGLSLNDSVKKDLIARAKQNSKRFSWAETAQQTLKVLKKAGKK